jgi:hypothetical protein
VELFRVFPWVESATADEPGHPLYISPIQGAGRIDNPEHYLALYASDVAAGAVAEAFGNHAVWTPALLSGPPALTGSRRALGKYSTNGDVLDLDDAHHLVERSLRPSRVITRRREVTQGWALAIFLEHRWTGVRWWGYHNPDWGSLGIWNRSPLELEAVEPLTPDHSAVVEAAQALNRPWNSGAGH